MDHYYDENDNLAMKIDRTMGTTTNMNPPASRTKDAINILVRKIEELEREIKDLKKNK